MFNIRPSVAIVLQKPTQHFIVRLKEPIEHVPCILWHGEVFTVLGRLDPLVDVPVSERRHGVARERRREAEETVHLYGHGEWTRKGHAGQSLKFNTGPSVFAKTGTGS